LRWVKNPSYEVLCRQSAPVAEPPAPPPLLPLDSGDPEMFPSQGRSGGAGRQAGAWFAVLTWESRPCPLPQQRWASFSLRGRRSPGSLCKIQRATTLIWGKPSSFMDRARSRSSRSSGPIRAASSPGKRRLTGALRACNASSSIPPLWVKRQQTGAARSANSDRFKRGQVRRGERRWPVFSYWRHAGERPGIFTDPFSSQAEYSLGGF